MRKLIAVAAALGLVASLSAAPALAAKPKKVHDSFGATLAPFPNLSSSTGTARPGCAAGEEGVHWVAQEFAAPGKGTLRIYMEGFAGDHDLYVFQGDVKLAESIGEQAGAAMAPAEEEILLPLKKGQKVTLIACNWLGSPSVEAHYEGTFK